MARRADYRLLEEVQRAGLSAQRSLYLYGAHSTEQSSWRSECGRARRANNILELRNSELRQLSVELFEKLSGKPAHLSPGVFEELDQNATDTGYGKHFIRDHGAFVRYNAESAEWLVYSQGAWRTAHDEVLVAKYFKEQWVAREKETELMIKELFAKGLKEAQAKKEADRSPLEQSTVDLYDETVENLEYAQKGQNVRTVNAALEMARTEDGVSLHNNDLDADPLLFNAFNAAIDLTTSDEVEDRMDRLCSKQSLVAIFPENPCPQFEKVLAKSLPDESVREYMQDFFGLCVSGIMTPDIPILLGPGANGKSLLIAIMAGILGSYYAKASMSSFLQGHVNPGGARSDLAAFRGKRLITASEANRRVTLDLETLKDWSGGESVNARDLWQKARNSEFRPQAKILLSMNHSPKILDQSEGAWRRLKYIKFDVIIPAEERNDKLATEVLETEGGGVLNWCLRGWERCRERMENDHPALVTPEKIADDTNEFREQENATARFFEEHLEVKDQLKIKNAKTAFAIIFKVYANWCEDNREWQETAHEFAIALRRWSDDNGLGITKTRMPDGQKGYQGVRLKGF